MYTRSTRMSVALADRPELRELLPAFHPAFSRLSHPVLGKVLPRLVTVEDAARIAGVEVDALLAVMNLPGPPPAPAPAAARKDEPVPEWLSRPAEARTLDVRHELAAGQDPFARIMSAVRELPAGAVLTVLAPFEPAPLRRLLGDRGWVSHAAWDGDTCRCSFWRAADGAVDRQVDPGPRLRRAGEGWELDVRGLEPPEPLRLCLAAVDRPEVRPLVIRHHREPVLLYPRLAERGLRWTVEVGDDEVRIVVGDG